MKWLATLLILVVPWLAQAEGITVLGWSKDEQFVALRIVTDVMSVEDFKKDQKGEHIDNGFAYCPNYTDPITKRPFSGELSISVFKIKQRHKPMPGSSRLEPVVPPFVIYKKAYLQPYHQPGEKEFASCSTHRQAKRALVQAKASMKKHGINLAKPGKNLKISGTKPASRRAPMRVFTVDGWTADKRDELSHEIDEDHPIQARISAQYFHDNMHDATIIGRFDVVYVRPPTTSEYIENGVNKSRVRDTPDGLIGSLPWRVEHPLPHAGGGGFEFEGVFASPTGRVLLFGVQQWNFDAISGYTRRYQLPFAYMRWDAGK
jgi:hypothetical protein